MKYRVFILTLLLVSLFTGQSAQATEFDQYDIGSVNAELTTNQAGGHPDLRTQIRFAEDPASPPDENGFRPAYAFTKDVSFRLPPGLLANLNSVSTCTAAQFVSAVTGEGCPFGSQVGISVIQAYSFRIPFTVPIFNLETTEGSGVARLGVYVQGVPAFINVKLRSNEDFGATAELTNISALALIQSIDSTIWGVPAASSHDRERLTVKESVVEQKSSSPPRSSGRSPEPFLINPTTCDGPLSIDFAADSYQEPGAFHQKSASLGPIVGCPRINFQPSFKLEPTTREAAAPSGADATLAIPQDESPNGLASSALRDAVIELPQGVTISPGAAEGLEACSESQVRLGTLEPAECPQASKIASVEVDSPSLTRPLQAAVYQRTPEPGHLTRAWLVADELGVHLKIPGEFRLDPSNGQITSLFLETPQVPVREFKLHFKRGPNGVLATPRSCGTYATEYRLRPWSGNADAVGTTAMTFDQNCGTGGFAPKLEAGPRNPTGGVFSPLVANIVAAAGEQNLAGLRVTMPPGVLAKLAGVPVCPDVVAVWGGCPAGSQVGTTTVAAGPGPSPLWIPQPGKDPTAVYLAGPYKGAPYSLAVKTPAQAGPFDLGDVVVRVALYVDPTTTQVTAVADPLPQILEGIPIDYRMIHLAIDRPQFTLNPTSCDPMEVRGTATSVSGAVAPLANRFQVGDCGRLQFAPKLQLRLQGSMKRSSYPAVSATLKMPSGGANISKVKVTLPKGLQIENAHINNPCTRVQFNADACPPKSVLGQARAFTPLLDTPLEGPVYFRSNGGERELPDIVADLQGRIHVVLVGFIDAKNGRIRTTFANVPDAPASKFRMTLFGGKRGLLVNGQDLCKSKGKASLRIDGQNGKTADSEIGITSCGRKAARIQSR